MSEPVGPVGGPVKVVNERPGMQILWFPGPAPGLEQARTADGKQCLLEQLLRKNCVGYLVGKGYPNVEIPPIGVDFAVVDFELDDDVGVQGLEMGKLRHQPFLGNHLNSNQFQKRRLAPVAVALGRVIEIREDALDILQIGLPCGFRRTPCANRKNRVVPRCLSTVLTPGPPLVETRAAQINEKALHGRNRLLGMRDLPSLASILCADDVSP